MEAAEPGDIITYHPQRLAAALHIADVNRLAVETSVMGTKALVTIYPHDPHDPLARVVLADPEMLVMDARGRIWIGRYHNGRPSLLRLYDPASGSAQRLLLFGTTGAGKSTAGPADSLEQRLAQLVRMLHTPVVLDDGRSVDVGASVGAAVPHGVGSRDLSLLQRAADASLYDGKHSRRAILATRQHLTVPSINGRRDGRPGTSMWGRAA
ncbi:hypothetical protein AB0N28_01835 [Streptomyces sp. NPDC051130]|uniref:hypothetical protein n=1 Tax=Streptomyces sp. NPDC051130 TaxID=3157223 RepID=UPI00341508B9